MEWITMDLKTEIENQLKSARFKYGIIKDVMIMNEDADMISVMKQNYEKAIELLFKQIGELEEILENTNCFLN